MCCCAQTSGTADPTAALQCNAPSLQGISSSAAQMLELLRSELQAISLRRRASENAAAQQPGPASHQQEQQQQQQHARPVVGILVAPALRNPEQQQQQQVPALVQPPPPSDRQPASGKVPGTVPGTVVEGVPAGEQPAPPMAPPLHMRAPVTVAADSLPPGAAQLEALKVEGESSLPPAQGHRQPPAQGPMERQQHPLQPAAARQPAAVIVRQQRAVAAAPSERLPPPTVEEQRSGDVLLAEILQDISGLETTAAGPADAAGAAAAAVGMEVEAAAVPRPLSPTLAAMACGGAEPGLGGGVAVVSVSEGRASGGGGGGLQPERVLREAEDLLRDILGEGEEPEALPGITVQQVHPQQGGQLPAPQAGQQVAQQDPPRPAANVNTGAGPLVRTGPPAAAAAAAAPLAPQQ